LRGDGFARLNLWRASSTASAQTTRHAFSNLAASRAASRLALVALLPPPVQLSPAAAAPAQRP